MTHHCYVKVFNIGTALVFEVYVDRNTLKLQCAGWMGVFETMNINMLEANNV